MTDSYRLSKENKEIVAAIEIYLGKMLALTKNIRRLSAQCRKNRAAIKRLMAQSEREKAAIEPVVRKLKRAAGKRRVDEEEGGGKLKCDT